MSRRTASQSRLFYTSIETIFPALTVNLLTVPVFIIDILSLGCSPEKIFYPPPWGYISQSCRTNCPMQERAFLSLRRTSTHSLGSGALVGSAVGGRQAENERTWPTSSEPKISCSCNVLKLSAQSEGMVERFVATGGRLSVPREAEVCEGTGHKNAQPTHPERNA